MHKVRIMKTNIKFPAHHFVNGVNLESLVDLFLQGREVKVTDDAPHKVSLGLKVIGYQEELVDAA